jgi:alanine dehydrogenase
LNNATFPYLLELANRGIKGASNAIREGVNTYEGHIVYKAVAESQGKPWKAM